MANYYCAIRTNYFQVKDPKQFRQFMSHTCGVNSSMQLWERKNANGQTVFGFGADFGISCLQDALDIDEAGCNAFICGLQQHVQEEDAVIILEIGQEKLCYLVGSAMIITCNGHEYLDISDLAQARAATMLNNPGWQTQLDY